jgi:hypothetical protein
MHGTPRFASVLCKMEPAGTLSVKGKRRILASNAESELTICNRCGIVMMETVNGVPAANAHLYDTQCWIGMVKAEG